MKGNGFNDLTTALVTHHLTQCSTTLRYALGTPIWGGLVLSEL